MKLKSSNNISDISKSFTGTTGCKMLFFGNSTEINADQSGAFCVCNVSNKIRCADLLSGSTSIRCNTQRNAEDDHNSGEDNSNIVLIVLVNASISLLSKSARIRVIKSASIAKSSLLPLGFTNANAEISIR